ncbi:SURF1 family protein [Aestuariirhabdus litorea]|uniref:SURF1-like protein n=1 Tax=Aestuariirhabdus litorea TaxID=2528527 RepID=A0A3P3VIK5_9GAMM|nr:SURF1 family protein [Aestuariirhabdus litorea]RRJ82565.1 SURF1 family protein [Aestuariirhabdus litorea]RWW92724.1 SURF1 family protein [Endozoicomonadaceae bacterium GTF-13]
MPIGVLSLVFERYYYRFSWWLSVGFLLLFSLFVGLAVWQWDRAQQKLQLQQRMEQLQGAPDRQLTSLEVKTEAYQRIQVEGRYLKASSFLLDNIVSQGKTGFAVMTSFELNQQGPVILVNRGWIPAMMQRDTLPGIETPEGRILLSGTLMAPRSKPLLGADLERPDIYRDGLWQYLDLDYLQAQVGRPLFPWVLQLDPDAVSGFKRQKPQFDAKVGMHYGYFLHWLVFALFSVAAYLSLTIKKRPMD